MPLKITVEIMTILMSAVHRMDSTICWNVECLHPSPTGEPPAYNTLQGVFNYFCALWSQQTDQAWGERKQGNDLGQHATDVQTAG